MINLTAKERMLLEDEKSHEELCVSKYKDYASKAKCQELSNLFSSLSQKEQQHLDSINQILSGITEKVKNLRASTKDGVIKFADQNQVIKDIKKSY